MYLYQSLFSDFISGIVLAINPFLWFFKYKKYVIIAVFDSTESGNAPSSPSTALFADVLLTPKMCLQNLKRDFSVVQSGFISYPQISYENKTIGLIRLLNVSMSVSCEIKLHLERLYILWDALIPFLARSSIADLNFPFESNKIPRYL